MKDLVPFLQYLSAELRRRRVFRVAGAYAAASFVLWQAADIAFPALGLPAWTMTFVVAIVLLGFPLVVVLAWIFDMTPTGLQRTEAASAAGDASAAPPATHIDATPAHPVRPAITRPAAIAAVAGVVILSVAAGAFAILPREATATAELSIVVLPFANQSGDAENEYFSDGVAEAILGRLNRLDNLRVISRTSSMSYKGTAKHVREIGAELGVGYVVEGSVSRVGNRVRIHAQLIEAATDRTLWSDSFNRELDDIFALETEISERIAAALRVRLTAAQRGRLASTGTNSVVAYDLYMKARQQLRTTLAEDWAQQRSRFYSVVSLYQQALEADPEYALAWAELAHMFLYHVDMGVAERRDSAEAMARRAIELGPSLPEGYIALGFVLRHRQRPGVERQFQLALERDPSHMEALLALARIAQDSLRYVEAGRLSLRAARLAPTEVEPAASLYAIFRALGDYDEAERWLRLGMSRSPEMPEWYFDLGLAHLRAGAGDTAAVLEYLRRSSGSLPQSPFVWNTLSDIYHTVGDYQQALRNTEQYVASLDAGAAPPRDRAFAMLDHAWDLIAVGDTVRGEELLLQAERMIMKERESCPDTCINTPIAMIRAHFGDVEGAVQYLTHSIRIGWVGSYPGDWVDRRFRRVSHDPRINRLIGDLRTHFDAQRDTLRAEVALARREGLR